MQLYEFYFDSTDLTLALMDIPEKVLNVARALDGKTGSVVKACEMFKHAVAGVGTVTVEDGYILWEISVSALDQARALERWIDGNPDEIDGGSDEEIGVCRTFDGDENPLRKSDIAFMIEQLRQQGSQAINSAQAVLIRFRPVRRKH